MEQEREVIAGGDSEERSSPLVPGGEERTTGRTRHSQEEIQLTQRDKVYEVQVSHDASPASYAPHRPETGARSTEEHPPVQPSLNRFN